MLTSILLYSSSNYTDFVRRKEVTISSSLLQLTGRIRYETGRILYRKVAESDNSSLSYILNYFITHRTRITSRYNERVIESYLEKLREVRATVAMIDNKSNQRFVIEDREIRAARARTKKINLVNYWRLSVVTIAARGYL